MMESSNNNIHDSMSSDEVCSQKSNGSAQLARGVSNIKRADEEEAEEVSGNVQRREKEDRARLNAVRTQFY